MRVLWGSVALFEYVLKYLIEIVFILPGLAAISAVDSDDLAFLFRVNSISTMPSR